MASSSSVTTTTSSASTTSITTTTASSPTALPLIHYLAGTFCWSPSQSFNPSRRSVVVSSRYNFVFVVWGEEFFCAPIPLLLELATPNLDVVKLEKGEEGSPLHWFASSIPAQDIYMSPDESIIMVTFGEVVCFLDTPEVLQQPLDQSVIWAVHNPRLSVQDVTWLKDSCYILWSDGSLMATRPRRKYCKQLLTWAKAIRLVSQPVSGMISLASAKGQTFCLDPQSGLHCSDFELSSQEREMLLGDNIGILKAQTGEKLLLWDVAEHKGRLVHEEMSQSVYLEANIWGSEFVSMAWDDLNRAIFTMDSAGCLSVFRQVDPCWFSRMSLTDAEVNRRAHSIAVLARVMNQLNRMEAKMTVIRAGFEQCVGELGSDIQQVMLSFMKTDE